MHLVESDPGTTSSIGITRDVQPFFVSLFAFCPVVKPPRAMISTELLFV